MTGLFLFEKLERALHCTVAAASGARSAFCALTLGENELLDD
jgi:hypothetical protein